MTPRESFRQQLNDLHRRTKRRILVQGLARVLAVAGPMGALTVWSLGLEPAPGGVLALGLLLSLGAACLALVWHHVLRPWLLLRRSRDMVRLLEQRGDFANILVAGEESLRLPERWTGETSLHEELQRRVYRQGLKILGFLRPDRVHPLRHGRLTGLGLVLALSGVVLLATAVPEQAARGWQRLGRPLPEEVIPPVRGLYPWDTAPAVTAGESVQLQVRDFTGQTGAAICEIRRGEGLWQPLTAEPVMVSRDPLHLPVPFRQWAANLDGVREDFSWRFRRGSVLSPERRVRVRHHPLLTRLGATIQPPDYTGLQPRILENLPTWIEVPAGSVVSLAGQTNHGLVAAALVQPDGSTRDLTLGPTGVEGDLLVNELLSFHVALEDSFGLQNQAPLTYEISSLPDEKPLVQLTRPGDDGLVPLDGLLPLKTDSADDYGLVALATELRIRSGEAAGYSGEEDDNWEGGVVPLWSISSGEVAAPGRMETAWGELSAQDLVVAPESSSLRLGLSFTLDVSGLELLPGDVLEIRQVATDNRRPGPGQTTHSGVLRLVLPSAAEVLANQAESSEQRRDELEEARRRGRELGADLDRLNRELLKNPVPDWARRQEMEQAIERQKGLQEELARLAAELQKDLERLAAGQMTSERLLAKAAEVAQLLEQEPGQSLQELLERMQDSENQVAPQEMAQAIREVAQNQKDMARRLDAALAMMERMEQEQQLEGLTALLEQMIRKQQELADQSRELAQEQQSDAEDQAGDSAEGENPEGNESGGEKQDGSSPEGEQPAGDETESQDGDGAEGENPEGQENPAGEQSSTPDPEELARRQEALAEEFEQLKDKMEEALAQLEEQQEQGEPSASSEQMEQALRQALEKMEEQQKNQGMKKASEQLAQLDPEQAAQLQQEAARDLGSLYHVLLETQQAMQSAMQENQVSSLRGLAADMLALSTRQEEISAAIPPQLRDVRSLNLTRSQHRLQRAAIGVRDDLSELLDESPTRIMRLLGKLDGLIERMGHTVQAMEDNRGPVARRESRVSLADANRIVIGLLTEAQITSQSSGSGSGSQQQSLSQQLQQMAQEQAKLNGLTDQLRQMLANRGLSQEVRAQMKRLGEAQGNLAGRLEELEDESKQAPEGERLLGDLGEMGRQMETIGGELDDGLVSEETLVRQERILSRLLDARNSVRRRDYSNRRESRTALDLYGDADDRTPGTDPGDLERTFRLRYQALEKAPLEYRDLVRRYFTALDSLRSLDPLESSDALQGNRRKDLP